MLCRLKRVPQYMGGVLVGELSDMWIDLRLAAWASATSFPAWRWIGCAQQGAHSVEIQVLNDNEPAGSCTNEWVSRLSSAWYVCCGRITTASTRRASQEGQAQ